MTSSNYSIMLLLYSIVPHLTHQQNLIHYLHRNVVIGFNNKFFSIFLEINHLYDEFLWLVQTI